MSTYFKAGQKVRRIGEGTPFAVGTPQRIDVGDIHTIESVMVSTLGSGLALEGIPGTTFDPQMFEVVEAATTTPAPSLPTQASDDDGRETAPLDPGAVKAGDTVTLQGDKASLTGEVQGIDRRIDAGQVIKLHHSWFRIDGPGAWTLTAHQPAPEPEPEWKPGTVALATTPTGTDERVMRTTAYGPLGPVWLDTHSNRLHESEASDVRPLVVIDPASGSVRQRIADVLRKRFGGEQGAWLDDADAVLSTLGLDGAR